MAPRTARVLDPDLSDHLAVEAELDLVRSVIP